MSPILEVSCSAIRNMQCDSFCLPFYNYCLILKKKLKHRLNIMGNVSPTHLV
jgi:hypothetical protein